MAGGKTYVLCALAIILAKIYPGSRWALVRADNNKLKKNLIPEFFKLFPESFAMGGSVEKAYNKTDKELKCANGSVIIFWPAVNDRDKDLDRWKGLNVSGFLIDEANEIPYDAYIKAGERAGRWKSKHMPNRPPSLVVMSCNPARGWIKSTFYDRWVTGALDDHELYIPAYATDNPSIDDDVREEWERMRKQNPAWYERFILGNWDMHEVIGQLISVGSIEDAFKRGADLPAEWDHMPGEYYLGVDVALKGKDKTVLALRKGDVLVDLESWDYNEDTSEVAKIVRDRIIKYNIFPGNVTVDVVGIGAGVASELKNHYNMPVIGFNSSARSEYEEEFYSFRNLRSEGWWKLRERLIAGEIAFAPSIRSHRDMIDEMCAVTYDVTEKVLFINKKDDIKKDLGRSPDYADAVMYSFVKIENREWLHRLVG